MDVRICRFIETAERGTAKLVWRTSPSAEPLAQTVSAPDFRAWCDLRGIVLTPATKPPPAWMTDVPRAYLLTVVGDDVMDFRIRWE